MQLRKIHAFFLLSRHLEDQGQPKIYTKSISNLLPENHLEESELYFSELFKIIDSQAQRIENHRSQIKDLKERVSVLENILRGGK